jgi:hypothetical protein
MWTSVLQNPVLSKKDFMLSLAEITVVAVTRNDKFGSFIFVNQSGNSVGIATGYGLNGRSSIPGSVKIILFSTACRTALGSTQPPVQWAPGVLSPGVKWPGLETDYSPVSRAEIKNDEAIFPPLLISSWRSA